MERYQYVTGALREEQKKWDEHAEVADKVSSFIASARLEVTAFMMVAPSLVGRLLSVDTAGRAVIEQSAYEGFRSKMEELTRGAAVEFRQIGDACVKMADKYDDAEEISTLDLDSIYRA